MPDYFLSDVHLRFDHPERARRLSQFLDRLTPDDRLIVAGDLCDFWMGSRHADDQLMRCPALRALAALREGGGELQILAGNHDHWLCPFYEQRLGARIVPEPYALTSHGLRLHLVHGHLLGARKKWKSLLESRGFFRGFGMVPGPFARGLDAVLEAKNQRGLVDDEERHLAVYRAYAEQLRDQADLVVFGHVHRAVDEPGPPRLVVLGGWQNQLSFLEIDARGARLRIGADAPGEASPLPSSAEPSRATK